MTDQRRHPRYPVELAAELTVSGRLVNAKARDISEGGVAVQTRIALPENQRVAISLILTQDGIEDPDEEPLECAGIIRWARVLDTGAHIAGAQFEGLDSRSTAQLLRFLEAIGR